jgi:hypothetical protein
LWLVKPSVQTWRSSFIAIRKEEVILTRLWIGHTRLTYGHLLCGELSSFCNNWGTPLTVSHILVDCPRYAKARHLYHLNGALPEMLGDDRRSISNVLGFLNTVGMATAMWRTQLLSLWAF